MRAVVVLAACAVSGCLGPDRSLPSMATDASSDAPTLGAAPSDAASVPPSEGGAAPTIDCLGTDPGASHPETLTLFQWQNQTGTCPSSACVDFFTFKGNCGASLQVNDATTTAQIAQADCDAFSRWVTSDRFLAALRDPSPCPGATDQPESFGDTLTTETLAKKTFNCPVEPFITVRACIAQLRAKYF